MALPRVISKSLASIFKRANNSVPKTDQRTISKFNEAREIQGATQIIYNEKAKRFYSAKNKRSKRSFRTMDTAAKINAKKVIERKEAFSDLLRARAESKGPLTPIEKKAYKLTKGIYRGDFCSFESYSGRTYEGIFRRITTAKVRTNSGIKEVLAIEITPMGQSKSVKLAVDLLEKSN